MLKRILSPETCARCRICCGFDSTDLWEMPVLPEETVLEMRQKEPTLALCPSGNEETFAVPALETGELYTCPMLGEMGCLMGEDKPFDCKIWPFRLMRDEFGTLRIAVAAYCPGLQKYTDKALRTFLGEGLAEKILAYGAVHPAHVKPYHANYRWIW